MDLERALPLLLKTRLVRLFGKNHLVINLASNRIAIRPFSYDPYVLGEIFWQQTYTPTLVQVKKPQVVFDLGANIGAFSLWAAQKWEPETIVSVEMDNENYNLLTENIRLNHLKEKIITIKAALWDQCGYVGINRHSFNHGMNSVDTLDDGSRVASISLEKLFTLTGVKRVDIVKMDIEGAESRLFNEANKDIFSGNIRYLIAELHPTRGVYVIGILTYLRRIGFKTILRRELFRKTLILEAINPFL